MGSYQSGSNAKFPRSLAFLCIEELARYADEWWERPDYEAIIDALTAEQKGPLLCMVASEHTDAMRKNEKLSAVLASGALKLEFSGCDEADTDVLERILSWQPDAPSLPLERLDLTECSVSQSLASSIACMPSLITLSFSRCSFYNVQSAMQILSSSTGVASIECLDLSMTPVSDSEVSLVLERFAGLRRLNISACRHRLTQDAFAARHIASSQLSHLDLSGNRGLCGNVIRLLSTSHVGGVPETESARAPRLSLHALLITGTTIDLESVSSLPRLDCLKHLEAGECEGQDSDLAALARQAVALERLDLSWCDGIGDQGVIALASSASATSLRSLNLRKLEISDLCLHALRRCSLLCNLVLARCERVTDAGLQHVGHLTHLQELNLAWLESISGEGLIACLTPLAKMQRLDLEGLKLVTDEHLLLMRGAMPDLVHLNLTWCSDPTDEAIGALVRARRTCVLDYYGNPRTSGKLAGYSGT